MAFIEKRLYEIEQKYAHLVRDVLVLSLTDETFRLIFMLKDGTTLRISERWREATLVRYSYYWLDIKDRLRVGWDNAPHHQQLQNFPHHKHIGKEGVIVSSYEMSLDDVIFVLEQEMASENE